MHGCRVELCLVFSKCAILNIFQATLPVDYLRELRTALYETSSHWQWQGSLFEVDVLINSIGLDWIANHSESDEEIADLGSIL